MHSWSYDFFINIKKRRCDIVSSFLCVTRVSAGGNPDHRGLQERPAHYTVPAHTLVRTCALLIVVLVQYSQTCVEQPPKGSTKTGCLG